MLAMTISGREFNRDSSGAKRAAKAGPVFITDRGKPAHVLLSIEEYQRMSARETSVIDCLGLPAGVEDIEIEFPGAREPAQAADFS
ncbi:antitoxin [Betaproteobacteria bacterium]|nr:antitoxin [Betaproteobacteria bacterium]